ncbi:MAG TPA: hypothetical protein VGG30_06800, partial [Pirellulales bacterium]
MRVREKPTLSFARSPVRFVLLLAGVVSLSFGSLSFGSAGAADSPTADAPATVSPAAESPAQKPDAKGAFELHHWGVWLADPALAALNSREHFTTSLPLSVETTRPRRLKGAQTIAPINVVTFRGQLAASLEVDLRLQTGGLLAHWPAAQTKNNRLRWLDYQLVATAP